MNVYRSNLNNILLIFFIFLIQPIYLQAQYESVIDSINKLNTPLERCRYAIGTANELLVFDSDTSFKKFLSPLILNAQKNKDQTTLEYLRFKLDINTATYQKKAEEYIQITQQIIDENLKKGNRFLAALGHHHLAQFYFVNQHYPEAVYNYLNTYEIYEEIGFKNIPAIDMFLHDFALVNYHLENYHEVIRLMYISMKFPPCNKRHHIQRYNNIGLSYLKLGEIDSALYYAQKTSAYAYKYNDSVWIGISASTMGDIFFLKQNYNEALQQYKTQFQYVKNTPYETVLISTLLNIAKSYILLDSIPQSKDYLRQVEYHFNHLSENRRFGEAIQLKHYKSTYYYCMYLQSKKLRNLEDALLYKDSLNNIQKSIEQEHYADIIKIASDKLIIEKTKKELETIQQTKERQKYIFLAVIVITLTLIAIIYSKWQQYKNRKQLEEENLKKIYKQTETEKQRLAKELNTSIRELELFKSKITELNKTIEKLEDSIVKNIDDENNINTFHEDALLLEKLKTARILTDEDWINFQSNFKTVYPQLTQAINQAVPIFTIAEKRYLMLTKLGFNNRDMAKIVGVSEGAMRITWKRIREKVNQSTSMSPIELINALENTLQTIPS